MAGPAGFTTDDVSDVTVLRELEKIKKFIVGKTVTDFSITEETESTIKVSITTNDKKWDVTLPKGGVIPQNLVYTNVNQEINSEKKFKQRVEFEIAEGATLESDNVAVKTEIETPEGLLVSQGVVAEAKESGVKVSKYNDGLECEISFGGGIVVSDPYTESDNVTTKNGMIKVLRDDVDENRDRISNLEVNKEDVDNMVVAWQTTPDNTHYPSEKLVYDSLNSLLNPISKSITIIPSPSYSVDGISVKCLGKMVIVIIANLKPNTPLNGIIATGLDIPIFSVSKKGLYDIGGTYSEYDITITDDGKINAKFLNASSDSISLEIIYWRS